LLFSKTLKVAIVSTHDCKGGAAKAAFRLHLGLQSLDCDSTLFCRRKDSGLDSVVHVGQDEPWWKAHAIAAKSFYLRLPVKAYRLGKNCDLFSMPTGPLVKLPANLMSADVINLHWVTSMIDVPSLFANLRPSTKVVWTLHDMNVFTGGCHYAGPCEKYRSHCHRCPELNSRRDNDLSARNFATKQTVFAALRQEQLTIVTPSRWLQHCVAASELLKRFHIVRIPYGVDIETFAPIPLQEARSALGICIETKVLLFVSDSLGNHRKGIDLLISSLSKIDSTQPLTLLAMGAMPSKDLRLPAHVKYHPLGFIGDEKVIAQAYSAADVFVITSRQDNLPNTILESLACGTPVVGFRIGGIPDLVLDGETGFCAEPEDIESLASAISSALQTGRSLRSRCRELVAIEYSLQAQAINYLKLFRQLTGSVGLQTADV
jgi:glycosyltransferase involved in cell wall biosynthesis